MKPHLAIMSILLALLLPGALAAGVFYVAPDGRIQDVIDGAASGDTVIVLPGIYRGPGNRDIDFRGKAILLRSSGGPIKTIIDCEGSSNDPHRGFYFHSGEGPGSVIDGFTVRNGNTQYGGGIYCDKSSPTIINCIITENSARLGAGILCDGAPTIRHCIISDNSTHYGGGGHGGGVYCYFGSRATISDCTFENNFAADYGGGIMCVDSETTVIDCIFKGNRAYNGGGISCYDGGNVNITNCVFTDNLSEWGGGISSWNSNISVTHCTIAGNWSIFGGGIFSYDRSYGMIANSILYYNSALLGHELALVHKSMLLEFYCNLEGGMAETYLENGFPLIDMGGNIDEAPMFADPESRDFHLLWDSPCLDAGTNYAPDLPDKDLDGYDRVMFGKTSDDADMGAYEFGRYFMFTGALKLTNGGVELEWLSTGLGPVFYDLYYSDDELSDTMTWNLLSSDIFTGGSLTVYTDFSAPISGHRYYRVFNRWTGLYSDDIVGLMWKHLEIGSNPLSTPFVSLDSSLDAVVGEQLTGHVFKPFSDAVASWNEYNAKYDHAWHDLSTGKWMDWYTEGPPMFTIRPDRAYWINILIINEPKDMCFTGRVSSTPRKMQMNSGQNQRTISYPVEVPLDESGLIESGFTGSFNKYFSDTIERDHGTEDYEIIWYDTLTSTWRNWDGVPVEENFKPFEVFSIYVLTLNSPFIWTVPVPYNLAAE